MPTSTPRLGLQQPIGTDPPSVIRTSITTNTAVLDRAPIYQEGSFAARPAASSVNKGTLYFATDQKLLYVTTDGATWGIALIGGAWTNLTAGPTFVTNSSDPPVVRLEGDVVKMRGSFEASGSGLSLMTTLPSGFRPSRTVLLAPSVSQSGGSGSPPWTMTIATNGQVNVTNVGGLGPQGSMFVGVEGLSFTLS